MTQNQFALERGLEQLVFDTIEAVHVAETTDELTDIFSPACKRLGFDHIGTFSVRDPDGRMIGHYQAGTAPQLWADHYVEREHFRHDAIVELLPQTLDVMVWTELGKGRAVSRQSQLIFDEAHEFGIADGFVLPQHYLDGGVAATILSSDHIITSNVRARAAMHILSSYFAMAVRRLKAPQNGQPQIRLSARQRECLQWVRAGKSDWEIGAILSISEHTVAEHIDAARKKFGVRTRTQAVIEALHRKLISL